MVFLESSPARQRLDWLLAGLDGRWPDDDDAIAVLAPEFAALVPADRFVAVMTQRSKTLAPIRLVGLDVEAVSATARFRSADGELWVARVTVDPRAPHLIVSAYASTWVPDYLWPGLPDDFESFEIDRRRGEPTEPYPSPVLVVLSGVPGSGKSTLAEQVGTVLGLPVFAVDWLLGALSPFGLRHRDDLMDIGEELLVTLAYRELVAGRSVIIDTTTEGQQPRHRWASLAAACGARLEPVVCVCSDRPLHRRRVEGRRRAIPGWQDAGDWADVELRLSRFVPWPDATRIDTAGPLDACVDQLVAIVGRAQ